MGISYITCHNTCMTSGKRLLNKVAPYATMLHGISNPYRLAIVYLLAHESLWPEDIATMIPIPQNLVAHHLKILLATGWVKKRRIGNHVMYALQKKAFKELPKLLVDTPFWREHIKPI